MNSRQLALKLVLREGGPGSGVGYANTAPIDMDQSPYVSVGTRKGMLDNMDYEDGEVDLKDITHVGQKNYVPSKMDRMMKDKEVLATKPIDVLYVPGEGYHMIDGHHRFLAASALNMTTLPARIYTKSEKTMPQAEDEDAPEPEVKPNTPEDEECKESLDGLFEAVDLTAFMMSRLTGKAEDQGAVGMYTRNFMQRAPTQKGSAEPIKLPPPSFGNGYAQPDTPDWADHDSTQKDAPGEPMQFDPEFGAEFMNALRQLNQSLMIGSPAGGNTSWG